MRRGATVKLELTRNEKLENKIVKGYQAGLEVSIFNKQRKSWQVSTNGMLTLKFTDPNGGGESKKHIHVEEI